MTVQLVRVDVFGLEVEVTMRFHVFHLFEDAGDLGEDGIHVYLLPVVEFDLPFTIHRLALQGLVQLGLFVQLLFLELDLLVPLE